MTRRALTPEWARVAAAYRHFGLEPLLDAEVTPKGFVYASGVAALASDDDPAVALHDLAHYLTAAACRQRAPNFGMGEHPAVCEPGTYPHVLSWWACVAEEAAGSYLNIDMARALFGEDAARRCAEYLNCDTDGLLCRTDVPVTRAYRRKSSTFTSIDMHRWLTRYGIPRWASRGIRVLGPGGDAGAAIFLDDASVREILRSVL